MFAPLMEVLQCSAEVDATKRYTAEQALAHPWVTGQQTPNKFLRSPKYLRTIRKENAAAATNGTGDDESSRITNRRSSH